MPPVYHSVGDPAPDSCGRGAPTPRPGAEGRIRPAAVSSTRVKPWLVLVSVLSLSLSPPSRSQPPGKTAPAEKASAATGSAQNWSLHIFSDAEGYREMSARGTEVHPAGPNVINVTDLSITVYSGDATAHVDTMLLSSLANFYSDQKRASGTKSVRVIRDDLEATGTRWTYDQAKKQVTLDGDVRIVFNAELKGLLK